MAPVQDSMPLAHGGKPLASATESSQVAWPLWGRLRPGPHAVGFRSIWELDWSRTYNIVFPDQTAYAAGKAPRPILINTWYPARRLDAQRPIQQRDYLAIETEDPRFAKFAAHLAHHEHASVRRGVTGKAACGLTDRERALLDEFWNSPTASLRDAPVVRGKFPLVIWRPGAGASFADNAVLCEFLASRGYVVMDSAFQRPRGRSLHMDVFQASARDTEFLIRHAREHPQVDWHHIGLAGHSAGAQSALLFASQFASPVDAVVSVDSTQDYFCPHTPAWERVGTYLLKNARNIRIPVLAVANAHAFFEVLDALASADRYYLTLRGLNHEDFVSTGIAHRIFVSTANPHDEELRARLDAVRTGYETICACILEFFNAVFKCDQKDCSSLLQKYVSSVLAGPVPHVEHVPAGATVPEPFVEEPERVPTPRQFRPLLAARGIEATIALLKRYYATDPDAAIFDVKFGYALVDELLETKQIPDAIQFCQLYATFHRDILRVYLDEGSFFRRIHAPHEALPYYNKAVILDPTNVEAAQGINALRVAKNENRRKRGGGGIASSSPLGS